MDRKDIVKKNTELVKINLEKALRNIPDDYSLLEVKQHIKIALKKINEIENKRNKRQTLKEKKKLKLKANSILIIDEMIKEEKKKLEDLES